MHPRNAWYDYALILARKASFIAHLLSLLSFVNGAYVFYRHRHYRLFEGSADVVPSTPSAHRVKVDSSPAASSPLRFLSNMLNRDGLEAASQSISARDVWEIAVWDPTPISLRLFCLLSPGHVLVYWLFLPTAVSDSRPSTTIITAIALAILLSAQHLLLCLKFSQQSKDTSIIHKEVMNEYDTKFVHPRTQPLMRDVGTQFCLHKATHRNLPRSEQEAESVDTYKPTFVINKGFQTRPNPKYAEYVDLEGPRYRPAPSHGVYTPSSLQTPAHLRDMSSPLRPQTAIRQPQLRPVTTGDGGSLGVYTHANSPLKKTASAHLIGPRGPQDRSLSPQKREGSPLKRNNLAAMPNGRRSGYLKGPQPRRESDIL